jgi:hypothetical protein
MTLKINMLAVAGALVLPAALMAQTTGSEMQPPVPTPPEQTQPPASDEPGEMSMPDTQAPDTQPPADQSTPDSQATAPGSTTPATAADLRTGATVHDTQGGTVGTIESADASGAVINTGTARARLPVSSFARDSSGLVIAMTKAQLEAAAQPQAPPQNPS